MAFLRILSLFQVQLIIFLEFKVKERSDFVPTCHTSKPRLSKKPKDAHSGVIFDRVNGIRKASGTVIDLAKTNTRAARFYA